MSIKSKIVVLFAVFTIFLPYCAFAQLDTAWMKYEYEDYYINPSLIDPACEAYFSTDSIIGYYPMTNFGKSTNGERYVSVAQRFDIEDTLRLSGVAIAAGGIALSSDETHYHDSIRVGIMNSDMSIEYQQIFISGEFRDGTDSWSVSNRLKFVECFFDDTLTITNQEYIYVFVESIESPCGSGPYSSVTTLMYVRKRAGEMSCGYETKYRPYLKICGDARNPWIAPENVTWLNNFASDVYDNALTSCDHPMYAPAGIFPMRVMEDTTAVNDTTTMALANVALAADAVTLYPNPTRSGEVTVEAAENILSVEIYDIANRLVRCESTNAKSVRLNLSALSSGTYLAKVRTESGTVARKFIIE